MHKVMEFIIVITVADCNYDRIMTSDKAHDHKVAARECERVSQESFMVDHLLGHLFQVTTSL